jgi:hypothetical protein
MLFAVDSVTAVPLRRPVGVQVSLFNTSAVAVFFDSNQNSLNSTPVGSAPVGNPLPAAAAGVAGFVQIDSFPGVMWFRSATPTTIQVFP